MGIRLRGGKNGEQLLNGFSFWGDENVSQLESNDIMNVLNATESFTLQWLIICYLEK